MGNMADALLKAGIIKNEDIIAAQNKEKQRLQEEQARQAQEHRVEERRQIDASEEERLKFALINDLYNRKKQFIAHLVYAFSPVSIGQRWFGSSLFETCPICNVAILTLDEALNPHKIALFTDLNITLLRERIAQRSNVENIQAIVQLMRDVYDGKRLGVSSPDSDKVLCEMCHSNLCEWIIHEFLLHNRHIQAIVNKKKRDYGTQW